MSGALYSANPLKDYFVHNQRGLIDKWLHYFEIYHRHFQGYRDNPITVVEFGVYHGGSLQMWKHYFGHQARIVGVDISPECKCLEEDQIEIITGDQGDRKFLRNLAHQIGPVDILIDDAGHKMPQQIATFEEMFPVIKIGGTYVIEDLHTSYWNEFGGKFRGSGTFVEYAKDLIDQLHAWHSRDVSELAVSYYTRYVKAVHIYDSVMVFDKGLVQAPKNQKTGNKSF